MSSLLNLPSWPMALAVRGLPPLPPLLALPWLVFVFVGLSARFMLSTKWARSDARVEAKLTTSSPLVVVLPWGSLFRPRSELFVSRPLELLSGLRFRLLPWSLFSSTCSRLSTTSSKGESASLSLGDSRPGLSTCCIMETATASAARFSLAPSDTAMLERTSSPSSGRERLSAETVCSKLSTKDLDPVVASGREGVEAAFLPVRGLALTPPAACSLNALALSPPSPPAAPPLLSLRSNLPSAPIL